MKGINDIWVPVSTENGLDDFLIKPLSCEGLWLYAITVDLKDVLEAKVCLTDVVNL